MRQIHTVTASDITLEIATTKFDLQVNKLAQDNPSLEKHYETYRMEVIQTSSGYEFFISMLVEYNPDRRGFEEMFK